MMGITNELSQFIQNSNLHKHLLMAQLTLTHLHGIVVSSSACMLLIETLAPSFTIKRYYGISSLINELPNYFYRTNLHCLLSLMALLHEIVLMH